MFRFCQGQDRPSDWESVTAALRHIRQLLDETSTIRQARSGKAKCDLILDLLFGTFEMQDENTYLSERVARRRDTLLRYGREDSAILLVSSWNATVDFLVEASDILGNTRVSQEAFTRMMEAGISGLELSSIPTGADRVRVGTLDQIANWPPVSSISSVRQPHLSPQNAGQEGYLRDDERDWLSSSSERLFPTVKQPFPPSRLGLFAHL